MILITRPFREAEETANLCHDQGWATIIDSQMHIECVTHLPLNLPIQAALFTSANGVMCSSDSLKNYAARALVVGDSTAQVAKQRGFSEVLSAQGDVDDLLELCRKHLDPEAGPVIHFRGEIAHGDLVGLLKADGFDAQERVVYRAVAKLHLDPPTIEALKRNEITSALFFSARTARVFLQNLKRHGLESSLKSMTAYCISPAVAAQICGAEWDAIIVSPKPDQRTLLDLISVEGTDGYGHKRRNDYRATGR